MFAVLVINDRTAEEYLKVKNTVKKVKITFYNNVLFFTL